jgi:hypothetical protein
MKILRIVLIMLVAGLGASQANPAESQTRRNDQATAIRQVESRFHRAFVDADTKAFDALLTSDFVWMHGTGEIATKAQLIESFRSGKARYKRDDIDKVKVTLYGSAAVVVGHNVRELGTGEVLEFNYTTTYVHQGGNWRIAVFHSSHCPCK